MVLKKYELYIIMENLPIDLQWNIMKFMSHPVADVFKLTENVNLTIAAMKAYNDGPRVDDSFAET